MVYVSCIFEKARKSFDFISVVKKCCLPVRPIFLTELPSEHKVRNRRIALYTKNIYHIYIISKRQFVLINNIKQIYKAIQRFYEHSGKTKAPLSNCCTQPLLHSATQPLLHSATAALSNCCTQPLLHSATAALNHCCTQPLLLLRLGKSTTSSTKSIKWH